MKFTLWLLPLFFSIQAMATTLPALHCKGTDSRKSEYAISVEASTISILNLNPDTNRGGGTATELRLIGKTNLGWKGGCFANKDPVVSFTSTKKIGDSHFDIAANPEADGSYTADFTANPSSGTLKCIPDGNFKTLEDLLSSAKMLDSEDLKEYWDQGLALSCQTLDGEQKRYHIRAFHQGLGNIDLMFQIVGKSMGGMSSFNVLTFGKNDDLIFKVKEEVSVQYESEKLPRLYIPQAASLNDQNEKIRIVTWVQDLTDPTRPMMKLSCVERQAWPAIMSFVAEIKSMPKKLPESPGTLAQVDHTLCKIKPDYSGIEEARKRCDKWGKLIRKIKLPQGTYILNSGVSFDRKGEFCPYFELGVSTREAKTAVQAILGDSIEGVRIQYQVAGKDD